MSTDTIPNDGRDGGELSAERVAEHCAWWVVSENHHSGKAVHIPLAVRDRDPLLASGDIGKPNDPDDDPAARPLCTDPRDVPWVVKSHAVLPPGWVDDERVCDRCADVFLEEVLGDGE